MGELGAALYGDSEFLDAQGHYQKAVRLLTWNVAAAREIGDRWEEGDWLGSLGNAYDDLGQVGKVIEYHQKALEIAREIGDRQGEGNHLSNLGVAYRRLGDTTRARQCLSQALATFGKIKSPRADHVRRELAKLPRFSLAPAIRHLLSAIRARLS